MAGAIKTLQTMLAAAPSLSGVPLLFGEEELSDETYAVPSVTMVPVGGPWNQPGDMPGYFQGASADLDNVWGTQEQIDLYLRAWSTATNAGPVDHADAVETLRANVLQALQYQRASVDPNTGTTSHGLSFRPTTGRWVPFGNAATRYGRSYVLSVVVDIAIPSASYVDAIPTAITLNQSI